MARSEQDAERERMASAMIEPTAADAGRPSRPAQWLTGATGLVFLVVAIWGFVLTGFDDFATHHTGEEVLGLFEVNGLHNLVHLVFGVFGLVAMRTLRGSLAFGWVMVAGYGAVFLYGLIAVGDEADVLALNWADNWLHLALTLLGAVIAGLAVRELRPPRDSRPRPTAGRRT